MKIYSRKFNVSMSDVNKYRFLRTSTMFSMLQLVSTDHLDILDLGPDKTLEQGLLWVLIKQRAEISRMPHYNEDILIKTWPTGGRHKLFQRHYSIETLAGEIIVKAGARWSLIKEKARTMITPERYGIVLEGKRTGNEVNLSPNPKSIETAHSTEFKVPFSYIDINCHMNNARYFDVTDDILPAAKEGLMPKLISVRYQAEALEGDVINVNWGFLPDETNSETPNAGRYYITCDSASGNNLKMQMNY